MAEGDLKIRCADGLSGPETLKLTIVNADDCTDYFTCDNKDESWESILKRLVVEDADGNFALNTCGCGGGAAGLIEVTYAELVALIGSSGLTPGGFYLLTDFATRHYYLDGDTTLTDNNTGATEALILLATSVNTINTIAFSPSYPKDIIHYDWDADNWLTDISFSSDGVNIISGWKGIITYRNDTIQDVICGYDFRNVKVRRWQADEAGSEFDDLYIHFATNFAYWDIGVDPNAYVDVYTFGSYYSTVRSVEINGVRINETDYGLTRSLLPNITFTTTDVAAPDVFNITINHGCMQMSFCGINQNIVIGNATYAQLIGNDTKAIKIGSMCNSICIGSGGSEMVINPWNGGTIIIGSGCYELTIGSWSGSSLTIGSGCYGIDIGSLCSGLTIGEDCYHMIFMNGCYSIKIGDDARNNVFDNNFNTVDFTLGGSTHVYGAYNCHFMADAAAAKKVAYINGAGTWTVAAATA